MLSRCHKWFSKKCRWNPCSQTDQDSIEFVGIDAIQMSSDEERRQSLPRRVLGRFLSERNINDEAEELKQLMKENGLYNQRQTLQQRRRLKQLLELEEITRKFLSGKVRKPSIHSKAESREWKCFILLNTGVARPRRARSLPLLPISPVGASLHTRATSAPVVMQTTYTVSCEPTCNQTCQSLPLTYLETAV